MALRPNAGHGFFILEVFSITHNDAPQSVGLLWTSDQLVAEFSKFYFLKYFIVCTCVKSACVGLVFSVAVYCTFIVE